MYNQHFAILREVICWTNSWRGPVTHSFYSYVFVQINQKDFVTFVPCQANCFHLLSVFLLSKTKRLLDAVLDLKDMHESIINGVTLPPKENFSSKLQTIPLNNKAHL